MHLNTWLAVTPTVGELRECEGLSILHLAGGGEESVPSPMVS